MAYTYGTVTHCKVANGQTRNEYECRLGYQVNSQNITNNTSNVTLRLEVRSTSSSYVTSGTGQTTKIDGTTVTSNAKFSMADTNKWQVFGTRTITITHNADGTYSASKSGSFTSTAGSSSYSLRSGSASVTVKPATIPRASDFTLNKSEIILADTSSDTTDDLIVTINRKSNSFKHLVKLQVETYSVSVNNIDTTTTFNCYPIWNSIKNKTGTVKGTVTVTTKNSSGTTIGDPKTKNVSIVLKTELCLPEINNVSATIDEDTNNKTGNTNTIIKDYSTVTFTGNGTLKKYADLNSVIVDAGGVKKAANITDLSDGDIRTFNFDCNIPAVKSNINKISLIDSRGIQVDTNLDFENVISYNKINIETFEALRLDRHYSQGGDEDISGTATKLFLEGTFWNGNFGNLQNNFTSISCQYKKTSDPDTSYENVTKPNGNPLNINDIVTTIGSNNFSLELDVMGDITEDNVEEDIYYGFQRENSYNIKLTLGDELFNNITADFVLQAGKPYIEINDGENGEGLIDFKVPVKSSFTDIGFIQENGASIGLGVGGSKINRGVFDEAGHSGGFWLLYRDANHTYLQSNGNNIYFRPNANSSGASYIDANGVLHLSANGLYSNNTNGIRLDQYGNIYLQNFNSERTNQWSIKDPSGNNCLAVGFNSKTLTVEGIFYLNGETMRCKPIYDSNTVTNATNMYITSNGYFRRTTNTSSERYKKDIKKIENKELNPEKLYNLEIKQFKYKEEYQPNEKDSRYNKELIGFIAEDLEKVYPIAIDYTEDGKIDNWNERYMIPAMLKLIQDQKKEIDELKRRISNLEDKKINYLQNM